MRERRKLVVASSNPGKIAELRKMLAPLDLELLSLKEALPEPPEIVEDCETFEENAIKKARVVAEAAQLLALADDSGLEVDALGGKPGVHSARFAGPDASDAENNAALLEALRDIREEPLTARFRCVLAVVDPSGGAPILAEGSCEGAITREPRGSFGFGYDPLFVLAGQDRTMAELDAAEKNRISHRAEALEALLPKLRNFLKERSGGG